MLSHLPNVCINESSIPQVAAVVSAPILKLCPVSLAASILALASAIRNSFIYKLGLCQGMTITKTKGSSCPGILSRQNHIIDYCCHWA